MIELFSSPPSGVVRVCLARLDHPSLSLAALAATLAPEESAHAARFVAARDRDRYVAARGLLREALGAALGRAPVAVQFMYGPNGRPTLASDAPIAFSVSHSGDHVALALALGDGGLALGVDIELARDIPDLMDVARSVFDEKELAALESRVDHNARLASFHRVWTRKEACMKATGAGMALEPQSFHVDADAPVQRVLLPPHDFAPTGLAVTVHDLAGPAGCSGALAVEGRDWTIEVVMAD